MPADANLVLQASTTQTASFNSAGLSLRNPSSTGLVNAGGTPRRGLKARVIVSAISGFSGGGTVAFKLQHSDDDSTWADLAHTIENATFATATGEDWIPFETDKPWIRLVMTLTGGSTPSVTYESEIVLARP